jgi:hypothetical protein
MKGSIRAASEDEGHMKSALLALKERARATGVALDWRISVTFPGSDNESPAA